MSFLWLSKLFPLASNLFPLHSSPLLHLCCFTNIPNLLAAQGLPISVPLSRTLSTKTVVRLTLSLYSGFYLKVTSSKSPFLSIHIPCLYSHNSTVFSFIVFMVPLFVSYISFFLLECKLQEGRDFACYFCRSMFSVWHIVEAQ